MTTTQNVARETYTNDIAAVDLIRYVFSYSRRQRVVRVQKVPHNMAINLTASSLCSSATGDARRQPEQGGYAEVATVATM